MTLFPWQQKTLCESHSRKELVSSAWFKLPPCLERHSSTRWAPVIPASRWRWHGPLQCWRQRDWEILLAWHSGIWSIYFRACCRGVDQQIPAASRAPTRHGEGCPCPWKRSSPWTLLQPRHHSCKMEKIFCPFSLFSTWQPCGSSPPASWSSKRDPRQTWKCEE